MKLNIVHPSPTDEKTGCLQCDAAAYSVDVAALVKRGYAKDVKAIRGKLHASHVNMNRNVSETWSEVDILFVLDTVHQTDDETGTPASSGIGTFLRNIVSRVIKDSNIRIGYSNIVRCRMPMDAAPTNARVRVCAPELEREIAARRPKCIVPLGSKSLWYFTGREGILAMSGNVLPEDKRWPGIIIMPLVSPGYVMRQDTALDHFYKSIVNIVDLCKTGRKQEKTTANYEVIDTLAGLRELRDNIAKSKSLVAYDTETGSLSPFDKENPPLLCLSFAYKDKHAVVVPWDHIDGPWSMYRKKPKLKDMAGNPDKKPASPDKFKSEKRKALAELQCSEWEERDRILRQAEYQRKIDTWKKHRERAKKERPIAEQILKQIMSLRVRWVAQNERFDRKHILKNIGVWMSDVIDTITIHTTLNDMPGTHGLDQLAFNYTDMGGYHKPLDDYIAENKHADPSLGGSYANIPGDILFPYAAMDADVTRRAAYKMMQDDAYWDEPMHDRLVHEFMPKVSKVLSLMEYNGAAVNVDKAKDMLWDAVAKRQRIADQLEAIPEVARFVRDSFKRLYSTSETRARKFAFNPGSDAQVRSILWDYYALKPLELTDTGLKVMTFRYNEDVKKNPSIDFQTVVRKAIHRKEWQYFSTQVDTLQVYKIANGNKFAGLILEYREVDKLIGTYYEPLIEGAKLDTGWNNAKIVRGNFNPHGTRTGRFSSSNPNLQNQPFDSRILFVSRWPGGYVVQADFSQIELRIAGCLFRDPVLIEAYKNGQDIHRITTLAITHLTAEQYDAKDVEEKEHLRTVAKRVNFGTIYGIGPAGIVRVLQKEGTFIGMDEATGYVDAFRQARPILFSNMEKFVQSVRAAGCVYHTFTGRSIRAPDIASIHEELRKRAERQLINAPVQGGASEFTAISLVAIQAEIEKRKLRAVLIMTVHDSIVIDSHPDDVHLVIQIMESIMNNVPKAAETYGVYPNIDWSWLVVPVVAEISVGPDWSKKSQAKITAAQATSATEVHRIVRENAEKQKQK